MARRIYFFVKISLSLLMVILNSLIYAQKGDYLENEIQDFSSNLPIIIIHRNGKIIPDESKITVDMKVINNGNEKRNYLTDFPNIYNGKIGIEIRGSSSQMFPKKQYGIETRDSIGNELDVILLGLPEENDWILAASYNDKTFLRDVLTFKLMNDMGHYASRYKFCELFLDDSYEGIYILFEKIKRNKNRVNIQKITETDSTGDNLTGGYIIKIDKTAGEEHGGWISNYAVPGSNFKIPYEYHYPRSNKITLQQQTYIKNLIRNFESIMSTSQYSDSIDGYQKYVDVNSFVDLFIINEFSKNVDSYRLSSYFYKDRDSDNHKLFAGPVWDYSLAFGNADYFDGWITSGFILDYLTSDKWFLQNDDNQVPFWWSKLSRDNNFINKVNIRWKELRQNILNIENLNNFIDSLALYLSEAQQRNFEKWKILGTYVWPNPYDEWILDTYSEQISYLKNWINSRINWIDWNITVTNIDKKYNYTNGFTLYQNYPNPFNSSTVISYNLPVRSNVILKIFNSLGQELETLIDEYQIAGYHSTLCTIHSSLPTGVYFYELVTGNIVSAKKMVFLK